MKKVNKTKMYNKTYWNDIVQLIFSYTYITFCFLINAFCFTQHTKWLYSIRSVRTAWWGLAFSHTACVSCLHKNVKFHHINNTYMLHPRLKHPLRAPCLWVLASKKCSISDQVCVSVFKGTTKQRFLFSEFMILTLSMFSSSVTELSGACFGFSSVNKDMVFPF